MRSLSVSLAGLRAGSALAVDGALQRLRGSEEDSNFARREARLFVTELGKLKGTYVKIGQMLAMLGEHFLPPVLTDALHDLESQTEALPWKSIEPDLRAALGHSGQLLDRYTRDLPDTTAALRTREALTECADRYLARCRRAAQNNNTQGAHS